MTDDNLTKEMRSALEINEEVLPFLKEFDGETDRAAVVLGAAHLDTALARLLRRALLPSATANDPLFAFRGPLGDFSGRIHLAYRLGLIDTEFSRGLHLVRKLRNAFAHETTGATLEAGPKADQLNDLASIFGKVRVYSDMVGNQDQRFGLASRRFRVALVFMLMRLEVSASRTEPVARRTPFKLVTQGMVDFGGLPKRKSGRDEGAPT